MPIVQDSRDAVSDPAAQFAFPKPKRASVQADLYCRARRVGLAVASLSALSLSLSLLASPASAGNRVASCGGLNQVPCNIFQAIPSCDTTIPWLYENFAHNRCRALGCGGEGQAPCTVVQHIPSCNPGLFEIPFGVRCTALDGDGFPTICGDTGERPCLITEHIPSCKGDDFEYDGLCTDPDADGYPAFCGGLNETPCDLGLQFQLGITSCKPRLEEDFELGICLDACGGNGLPACAIGGCDSGYSLQIADMIDNFFVCGKSPVAWGESDADEAAPGGPRVVFFIHGRGNDLTTATYDADEELLGALAFDSPNIVDVYGVDWNNQATGAVGPRRRVEIRKLVLQGSTPTWQLVERYGRREFNSTDFQISDVSQAIAQAIDDLAITTPITLLAHSYGGVIARDLVYRHYDDLRAGNHEIVEVVTIKSPHRGGLIGTPDLVSTGTFPTTGLVLQTDFACATGRVAGLAGFGSGHDGCLLGLWVDWALGKLPFGIDDTSYPQIRWITVAGGGLRTAASSIDLVLDAELLGVPVPLDPRFEQLLEDERNTAHEPFLDSDATVATRSAFGLAVDACYPYVQALPPGSSSSEATVVFDTAQWTFGEETRQALSATCYHAAATTGPLPGPRFASNHAMSTAEAERAFVVAVLTEPLPEPGFGAGLLGGALALRWFALRRRR